MERWGACPLPSSISFSTTSSCPPPKLIIPPVSPLIGQDKQIRIQGQGSLKYAHTFVIAHVGFLRGLWSYSDFGKSAAPQFFQVKFVRVVWRMNHAPTLDFRRVILPHKYDESTDWFIDL